MFSDRIEHARDEIQGELNNAIEADSKFEAQGFVSNISSSIDAEKKAYRKAIEILDKWFPRNEDEV